MSRSGYSDDCENLELYRASVYRAIHGKRGQAFLRELGKAMDEMTERVLIQEALITEIGECCTIGVVFKHRQIDVKKIDETDPFFVGKSVGIAQSMAAEIAFENDERRDSETPSERWVRMRAWVNEQLEIKI